MENSDRISSLPSEENILSYSKDSSEKNYINFNENDFKIHIPNKNFDKEEEKNNIDPINYVNQFSIENIENELTEKKEFYEKKRNEPIYSFNDKISSLEIDIIEANPEKIVLNSTNNSDIKQKNSDMKIKTYLDGREESLINTNLKNEKNNSNKENKFYKIDINKSINLNDNYKKNNNINLKINSPIKIENILNQKDIVVKRNNIDDSNVNKNIPKIEDFINTDNKNDLIFKKSNSEISKDVNNYFYNKDINEIKEQENNLKIYSFYKKIFFFFFLCSGVCFTLQLFRNNPFLKRYFKIYRN